MRLVRLSLPKVKVFDRLMPFMRKLAVLMGFVLAAMVAAGLFGVVHDQISYTVSPEYYTRFKFL